MKKIVAAIVLVAASCAASVPAYSCGWIIWKCTYDPM